MKTTDFLGNEWEITCMGCAIHKETMLVPGGLIKRTKHFVVNQDPLVPLPGFLVIASTEHIQSIAQMDDAMFMEFSKLLRQTHQAIKLVTCIENLTIIQEERSSHFHLWFFPWTSTVIEQYGAPSLSKIRGISADLMKESIDEVTWNELENSIKKIRSLLA